MRTFRCLCSLACAVSVAIGTGLFFTHEATAQSYSRSSTSALSSALQQQAKQLQDQLKKSTDELQKADEAARQADSKKKEAARSVNQTREAAEKDHEQKLNIPDALQAQETAKAAYEQAKAPVLKELHESADYKAAVAKADKARDKIKDIRQQAELSPKAKLDRINEQTAITQEPGHLEQLAIEANPKSKEAHDRYKEASDKLFELRKRCQKDVEEDAGLVGAKSQLRTATDEHKQAVAHLRAQQQTVAQEQAALAATMQQIAQAQSMSRGRRGRGSGS